MGGSSAELNIKLTGPEQINQQVTGLSRRFRNLSKATDEVNAKMDKVANTFSKLAKGLNRVAAAFDSAAASMHVFNIATSSLDLSKLERVADALGALPRGGRGGSRASSGGEKEVGGVRYYGKEMGPHNVWHGSRNYGSKPFGPFDTPNPIGPFDSAANKRHYGEMFGPWRDSGSRNYGERFGPFDSGKNAINYGERFGPFDRGGTKYSEVFGPWDTPKSKSSSSPVKTTADRWRVGRHQAHARAQAELQDYINKHMGRSSFDRDIFADLRERSRETFAALSGPAQRLPRVRTGSSSALSRSPLQAWMASMGGMRTGAQIGMSNIPGILSAFRSGGISGALGSPAAAGLANGASILAASASKFAVPVLAVGAAVAAAGTVLVKAMLDVSARARDFLTLRNLTGGSTSQTGQLRSMLGGVGLDGGSAATAVGRMTDRMMTDGMAMMWGARLGVRYTPGPYGDPNEAANILKIMDRLSMLQGGQRTQAAFAIAGGRNQTFDYLMRYAQLDDLTKWELKAQGKFSADTYTPKRTKEGAELMSQWDLLMQKLNQLFDEVIQPLIPVGTLLVRALNYMVTGVTAVVQALKWALAALDPAKFLYDRFHWGSGSIMDNGQADATQRNTDALDANTVQLRGFQREVFGRGAFANSAIPAGFSGVFLNRNGEHVAHGYGTL